MAEEPHTESHQEQAPLAPEDEAQLMKACASGDSRAWHRFVDTYGPRVLGAIKYYMRAYRERLPEDDALNVYQEMFLDLCSDNFRKLKTFRKGGRLTTWLLTVARRQCLDYVRARTRRKVVPLALSDPEFLDTGQPVTIRSDPITASENREAVLEALNRLTSRSRLVVILFYFEGLSRPEIAKITGVSAQYVTDMLKRARDSLSEMLGEK